MLGSNRWPKNPPELSAEQIAIGDDFMRYWLDLVSKKPLFKLFDAFNHGYPVRHAPKGFATTLEIGAGSGSHLAYERLDAAQRAGYVALELRENLAADLQARFPDITVLRGDCQAHLEFPDGHFDRIVATHVLEHLPRLPDAARELYRLSRKDRGVLSIVIPCEGSFANNLARKISSARIFERRYKQKFDWFIQSEHLSLPHEIFAQLDPYFEIAHRSFFPLPLPFVALNFCIGATLRPRAKPLGA